MCSQLSLFILNRSLVKGNPDERKLGKLELLVRLIHLKMQAPHRAAAHAPKRFRQFTGWAIIAHIFNIIPSLFFKRVTRAIDKIVSHVADLVTDCVPVDFSVVMNSRKANSRE
jgi:hypothetical protein